MLTKTEKNFLIQEKKLTRKSIKHKQPLQVRLVKSAITTTNELPQPKLVESSITPTKDPDKSNDPEGHLATNPCAYLVLRPRAQPLSAETILLNMISMKFYIPIQNFYTPKVGV